MSDAERAARRAQAADEMGRLAELVAEAQRHVPPLLSAKDALARRAALMRTAAIQAGRPWVKEAH